MTYLVSTIFSIVGFIYCFTGMFIAMGWTIDIVRKGYGYFKNTLLENKKKMFLFVFYFPLFFIVVIANTLADIFFNFVLKDFWL